MTNINNITGIPENVPSYDTGNKPYKHDYGRGKWAKSWDFYAVALSHCFGFRHFILLIWLEQLSGVELSACYTLGMITFVLPLYFTQMFLGQFSSSGLVSVFRIAPLFKGIGYVSVFLNIMTCSYFMVTAAFPLYIIFESMQPNLPWTQCTHHYSTELCFLIEKPASVNSSWPFSDFYEAFENKSFPIHEYVNYILGEEGQTENWYFSSRIMLCTFLVWALVGLILFKGVEMFGKIFRFITAASFICMLLITIRILSVHETWETIEEFFDIKLISFTHVYDYLITSPLWAMTAFGAGWGNVLTMASYNNFNEDIGKLTTVTCFIQMIVFILFSLIDASVGNYLYKYYGYILYNTNFSFAFNTILPIFISYAFYFSHLNWPHFWTILFFLVIFLSQFSEGAIQVLTILTAIFDEYQFTRIYKKFILVGLIGCCGLISIFFCTTKAFDSLSSLYSSAMGSKTIIILIELFVILWIYGRLRFQRDLKFMTGKQIQSWKIWMMRFVTPIAGLILLVPLYHINNHMRVRSVIVALIFLILTLVSMLFAPSYMISKVYTATGNILDRIKKLCRPNDWHPVDPIEHRNYENYLDNADTGNVSVHANMITEDIYF